MDAVEIVLLFDYYGRMLTDKQKEYLDMRYNQDLSLGEIAEELGISRQGVHDNLSRTEAQLRNMEEKTGCVSRDLACRKAAKQIREMAQKLAAHPDDTVSELAGQILQAVHGLEE